MTPSEYAQKLPEWVIPNPVDRDQLRFELKVLLEECLMTDYKLTTPVA